MSIGLKCMNVVVGFVLPPPEGIEVDDRKFLDHINAKIMKEANGSYNATNPKELTALLAEDTFQRLISTFEYFLQRTQVILIAEPILTSCHSLDARDPSAVPNLPGKIQLALLEMWS